MYTADIKKLPRHFVPADFTVTDWQQLEPFFKDLLERSIDTMQALEQWLKDQSELEAVVSEDACWRQIKMTCDTENKTLENAFNFYCMEIQPHMQPYVDALNKKLINTRLPHLSTKTNILLTCAVSVKALSCLRKKTSPSRLPCRLCSNSTALSPEK